MTTKKCVACGEEFVPSRSSQKYCPECREKGRTAEYYEHKVELNRIHAGDYTPKVFHNTCKVCGKEFVSVRAPKDICSVRCREKQRAETAKCPGCGVFLINKGNYTGRGYCSEECKEKALINKAIANGLYFPCQVCGKMFIAYGKNARYCSSECKKINTQRKKEERRQKYEENRPPEHEKRTCPICGKAFDVTRQARGRKYCSIACRQIAVKRRNEEAAIQKESQSVIRPVFVRFVRNRLMSVYTRGQRNIVLRNALKLHGNANAQNCNMGLLRRNVPKFVRFASGATLVAVSANDSRAISMLFLKEQKL